MQNSQHQIKVGLVGQDFDKMYTKSELLEILTCPSQEDLFLIDIVSCYIGDVLGNDFDFFDIDYKILDAKNAVVQGRLSRRQSTNRFDPSLIETINCGKSYIQITTDNIDSIYPYEEYKTLVENNYYLDDLANSEADKEDEAALRAQLEAQEQSL